MLEDLNGQMYQGIILAVQHDEFVSLGVKAIRSMCAENAPIYDLKSVFPKGETDRRL